MNNSVRRFGVLAPPGNTAMERELPAVLPAGVVMNHNRLSRPGSGITSESLLAMAESIGRASSDLAQAYPEVILYGCTSGSFLAGVGREAEVAQRIADLTGIDAVTTSTAVVNALRAVSAKRVFMLTPYPHGITQHEVEFLDHYGIETAHWDTFDRPTSEAIRAVSSEDVRDRVQANRDKIEGCDTVFISCTNLLSMDQIANLEQVLAKPVISSNQASLWSVLQHMQIDMTHRAERLFHCNGKVEVSRPKTAAAA